MNAEAEVALLVLSLAILQPQDWIVALEPDVHAAVREMRARQMLWAMWALLGGFALQAAWLFCRDLKHFWQSSQTDSSLDSLVSVAQTRLTAASRDARAISPPAVALPAQGDGQARLHLVQWRGRAGTPPPAPPALAPTPTPLLNLCIEALPRTALRV